jgi:hypothetical protein
MYSVNSPEAGDAAVTIVRQRQNLRAEKVIARKNIHLIRRNQKLSSILHRYLMSFYTSFRPLPPGLGSNKPRVGSFTVYASQQLPTTKAGDKLIYEYR